jgi:hypothetical protein
MEDTLNTDHRETYDRLVLLLISQPREGHENQFEEIVHREIERLAVLAGESGRNE